MLKFDANGLIPAVVQDATTRQVLMVGYMDREALRRTVESGQAWFWSRSRRELWHKGATSGHYLNVRTLRLDCDGDTILVEADPAGPTCHTGAVSCFFNDLDPADLAATGSPTAGAGTSPETLAQDVAAVSPPEPDELPLTTAPPPLAEPFPPPANMGEPSSPPPLAGEGVGGRGPDAHTVEALFAVIQQRQQQRPEGSYVVKLLDGGIDRIAKKVGEEATEVVIAAKNGAADEITWEVADLWFHSLVLLAATGLSPAEIWQELDRRRK